MLFSDVRAGEGSTGLALLASCFFLLLTTYLLKPARDGLLASAGIPGLSDMELKAYSSFSQSILLLAIVPLYTRLAARLGRRSLVTAVTLFFVSNLLVFGCLQPGWLVENVPLLGIVFYLWFGVFNLLAIVQFWSFAADFYSDEGGTRLFPVIAFGATAGAAVGAWLAGALVRSGLATTYTLLWLGAGALLVALALLRFADARDAGEPVVADSGRGNWSGRGAFRLVISDRYLLATAVLVLFANWVKTN
ncbi:MAG: NTP/NDP exchange transporter, partial [Candidatus Binatia bacterium]